MKNKTLSTFLLAMGVFSFSQVQSQISIDYASFPLPAEDFRMQRQVVQNFSSYKTPSEGENQTWDYTNFESLAANPTTFYISNDVDFPLSHHYIKTYAVFQNYRIASDFHEGFDSGGYFRYAKQQYDTTYSLAAISGNQADEIQFPDAKILFDGRANVVRFPLEYDVSWTDTTVLNTPFVLSAQMFGLNKTPGVHKLTMVYSNEVVGSGTLVMDDENGVESKEMEVLLVKLHNIEIDSFYIGGAPAPSQLLAAFGASQGMINERHTYIFYRKDYGDYLMRLGFNGSDSAEDLRFITYNQDGVEKYNTSTHAPTNQSVISYPNPIKKGEVLNVSFKNKIEKGAKMSIIGMEGKEVYSKTMHATESHTASSIQIPSNLSPGVYSFQIYGKQGDLIWVNKLMVTE